MRVALGLVLCALLSACVTVPTGGGDRYWLGTNSSLVINDAVSLLHYSAYVRNLAQSERDRETERQRVAFMRDKSDFRRMQYALCLSATPDAGVNERKLAQQLLEPILEGGRHDADVVALAGLLNASLQGQKRGDDLAQKLDAVKDIERSLMRREKGKP